MAHVFHVEFGINDTPLTRALEHGNYASAERLILDCVNPSYLDEGCYQRTPLFICLCGVNQDAERVTARNFYLARLLIERGANLNLRVPTFLGSEFMDPGKSSLQLLTDYYIDLTRKNNRFTQPLSDVFSKWSSTMDVVVGMNKEYLKTVEDILENVLDLVFIILRSGGDPNLVDGGRMTVLHRACMLSQDSRLLKLLIENGADVTLDDARGNTPLVALCDEVAASLADSYSTDLSPCSEDPDLPLPSPVNLSTLRYLLTIKDVDVNHQSHSGKTALFHCMVRGDASAASLLLRAGANPSLKGQVWESRKRKRSVSPLLAVFASEVVQHQITKSDPHQCITTATRHFAHLVDTGYFSNSGLETELSQLLEEWAPDVWSSLLAEREGRLVHRMFGATSCSLQQMAARVVFRTCLVDTTQPLQRLLPVSTFRQRWGPGAGELSGREAYEEYMGLVVNRTLLRTLVTALGLPSDTILPLMVELAIQQLGLKLSSLTLERPDRAESNPGCPPLFSDSDFPSSSDDTASEEGGDSDLEYW